MFPWAAPATARSPSGGVTVFKSPPGHGQLGGHHVCPPRQLWGGLTPPAPSQTPSSRAARLPEPREGTSLWSPLTGVPAPTSGLRRVGSCLQSVQTEAATWGSQVGDSGTLRFPQGSFVGGAATAHVLVSVGRGVNGHRANANLRGRKSNPIFF